MRYYRIIFLCVCLFVLGSVFPETAFGAKPFIPEFQQITSPPEDWPLFFYDDFNNNQFDWYVGKGEDPWTKYDFQVDRGKYRWSFTSLDHFWYYMYPAIGQVSDFYFSMTADQENYISDASYGVLFRHVDDDNFYYFTVEGQNQFFAVFSLTNGNWTTLKDWEFSSAIRPNQPNKIGVLAEGNNFTFFVNDQVIAELNNSVHKVGVIAIESEIYKANLEETFEFDDFTVYTPQYHAPAEWVAVFEDTFDNNENKWFVGNTSDPYMDGAFEITDGVYRWELMRRQDFINRREPDIFPVSDFYITTDIELTSITKESDGGITFRANNANEHYSFGINPNYQTFSIMVFEENDWIVLQDWTFNPAIKSTGVNTMAVLAEGSHLYCFVNDQLVSEALTSHLRRGMPGLAVEVFTPSNMATYEFDNFKVFISPDGEYYLHQGVELLNNGETEKAEAQFDETIKYFQQSSDEKLEADALETIGMTYANLYQFDTALDYYQRSLVIRERIGDKSELSLTLQLIGSVYYEGLDDFRNAIEIDTRIAELCEQMDSKYCLAEAIHRLGIYHFYLSEYEQAFLYTQQAIDIREELDDQLNIARGYNNIGGFYGNIGDYEQAIEYFQRAIDITEEINDNSIRPAIFTNNLGEIHEDMGDLDTALTYYLRANELFNSLDDEPGFYHAGNLISLSGAYGEFSEFDKAIQALDQAWEIMENKMSPFSEALLLLGYGRVYFLSEDYQHALDTLQGALALFLQVGNREGAIEVLLYIGEIYEKLDQDGKALESYLQAIEEHEASLAGLQSEEFKSSISGVSAIIYQKAIRLLYKAGRYEEAFLLSERNRARVFLESMGNSRPELLSSQDTDTLRTEEKIRNEIAALEKQIQTEKDKPLEEIDSSLVDRLQTQLSDAQNEYQDFITQLQAGNPELATLVSVPEFDLSETQLLLNENTTLVSYYLTDEDVLAFVITKDSFNSVALPTTSEEILTEVENFRGLAMSNLNNPQPRSLVRLYEWLVTPLLPYLSTPQIGIIPNRSLHYIPFAALTDGSTFLGENYSLFYLPSVSSLPFILTKQDRGIEGPLVFGNPTTGNPDLAQLNYAAQEAQAVAEIFSTEAMLEEEASEQLIKDESGNAGILHLAAHGSLNPHTPLFSRLWLSPGGEQDGRLNVFEVYSMDLHQASLVVLSACQTQLGDISAGDEVVSLNRAFLYSVPTVIASLWSVDDEASSYIMEQFYENLFQGEGKAVALQNAQAAVRDNPEHPEWQHPFYWAAFVLNGDPGSETEGIPQVRGTQSLSSPLLMVSIAAGGIALVAVILIVVVIIKKKAK